MPLEINIDRTIDIATGRHRKETNWKNKQILWSQLVEKLSTTHRTAETHAEYLAAKKGRQDGIKDIGGFVGGYLNSGRRKKSSVVNRQLVTLDIDYAPADMWGEFLLMYDCAAAIYSTHKHSPERPRLRLIIPLDRPVLTDEYIPIARRIAGSLGIDYFDWTTYQVERLMYWPSTPKDGVYEFHYQDGPWLSADEILASYRDWTDTSEWPVSTREGDVISSSIEKQGDPLEKPGVVGAFCRTYSITEAIETFLADVYDACDIENRYTYKEGSTSGGLVVYDDKFTYSHHGTDPVSGKLCNAFDLVRLHKFGLKDEDSSNEKASFEAMIDLAMKDPAVRKLTVTEKMAEAIGDFQDITHEEKYEEADEQDDSWMEKMDMDRKGNIYSTIDNICLILNNDSYFKGRMAYDDFEKCEVAVRDLPWRKITHQTRRLTDKDDANIRHYLEKKYGISSTLKVKDAMDVLSTKTSFHPVRDYLNSVTWDGEKRVDTLLIDYQGAVDTEYTRTVTRKTLVAAVKRIFQPGCKFDHVLTLVGKQGLKKSSLIAQLGRQWFSDSFATMKGKESFEQLQGVWLVEIAELAALNKAEVEATKHFITKREDRYRVAFGRRTENFPRQCVFFATTNKRDFLKDPTGDRRYWPVLVHQQDPTKDVFKDLNESEVAQVWAEAMHFYRKGESIYLNSELETVAKEIQHDHTEEHPWTGIIQLYLDTKLPEDWNKMGRFERRGFLFGDELQAQGVVFRDRVCLMEIWAEGMNRNDSIDDRSATAIRNIMRNMKGWREEPKPVKYNIYGIQRKGFVRTEVPGKTIDEVVTNTVTKKSEIVNFVTKN